MNTSTRVGGFALGLAAVAGVATMIGVAVGPVGAQPAGHGGGHGEGPRAGSGAGHGAGHGGGHGGDRDDGGSHAQDDPVDEPSAADDPGGLMVSDHGYRLQLSQDRFDADRIAQLRLRVTDADGSPVTAYETSHGKDLHLIVVPRDLTGFQHVHPTLDEQGTWSVPVALPEPGEYRVFADFKPAGAPSGLTLGHDLSVRGDYRPRALPQPSRTARTDGYDVELAGELVPGKTSELTLSVSRDGRPVRDLEPYLEAYGHLVALRDGDLAYLHVHPDGSPEDGRTEAGPEITFFAEVPSAGDYRLFLDFKHAGRVHTAAFTAPAGVDFSAITDTGASHGH